MTGSLKVISLLTVVLHCNGFSIRELADELGNDKGVFRLKSGRRYQFPQGSVIIGAPSYPSHLPEAEPILPGHTLIRPGLGMLKSALKFPHRELEGGSGVYGNWDSVGIRYDGKNERVLHSGFRRSNSNDPIVVYLPSKSRSHMVKTKKDTKNKILRKIRDVLNAEKQRNSRKPFEMGYSSEEIKKTGQGNRRDKFLSFMLQDGLKINRAKQDFDKNLKSWKLRDLLNTKDTSLYCLLKKIESLRRYENSDRNEKQDNALKEGESLDSEYDDRNKEIFKEIQASDDKNNNEVLKQKVSKLDEPEDKNSQETVLSETTVTSEPDIKTKEQRKQEWFWLSKDIGNHIKINPNAPDFNEFLPKLPEESDMEDIRSWWFFNQADHTKLQEKRRHD